MIRLDHSLTLFVSLFLSHLAIVDAFRPFARRINNHVRNYSKTSQNVIETTNNKKEASIDSTSLSMSSSIETDVFSYLDSVEQGPPDAILGIASAFRASNDPRKVNVCVGAYRDASGKPWVLPSVREAEQMLLQQGANKEYLPIEGNGDFIAKALKFAYGDSVDLENVAGVQSLSGTGACRIGGNFLAKFKAGSTIYIPTPTWGNHIAIFKNAGVNVERYRYYDYAKNGLDLKGMLEDIEGAPEGSIILLHACAHNPTGCDPTREEWKQVAQLCKDKQHLVFFDSAYQGFASGDAERDAWALRHFCQEAGLPVMLAQSFAKNFGLYGERCGTFSIVCADPEQRERVMSQLRLIIRPMYSSPPIHGASIVKTVLEDEKLTAQYYEECESMAKRILEMRRKLVETLEQVGSTHDWSHITSQIGMFAYTGMNSEMCDELTSKYEIYLTRDGRISLAGLNDSNVEYVAKAVHDVTDGKSITS